jgi:hypothetical protein
MTEEEQGETDSSDEQTFEWKWRFRLELCDPGWGSVGGKTHRNARYEGEGEGEGLVDYLIDYLFS